MRGQLLTFAGALAALVAVSACQPSAPPAAPESTATASLAADTLAVSDAWAASTPNGAAVGAGYLTLANNGDTADALLSVSSSRVAHVELHEMAMQGTVMQMHPVSRIDIPAHGQASLAPGGYHIMFMEISAPFVTGETVPITLTFEHHAPIELSLPVRDRAAVTAGASGMQGMDHGQH